MVEYQMRSTTCRTTYHLLYVFARFIRLRLQGPWNRHTVCKVDDKSITTECSYHELRHQSQNWLNGPRQMDASQTRLVSEYSDSKKHNEQAMLIRIVEESPESIMTREHCDDARHGTVCSEKFGLAYVVSKMGLLFVYAVDNLAAVYRQRISADPVFLAQVSFQSCWTYPDIFNVSLELLSCFHAVAEH